MIPFDLDFIIRDKRGKNFFKNKFPLLAFDLLKIPAQWFFRVEIFLEKKKKRKKNNDC